MKTIWLIDWKYTNEERFNNRSVIEKHVAFYEHVPGYNNAGCPETTSYPVPSNVRLIILHTSNRCAEHFYESCKNEIRNWGFYSAGTKKPSWVPIDYFFTLEQVQKNLSDFAKEFIMTVHGVPPFEILKYGSHGARIVNAHRLRYNILTPFVALHLSLQAYCEDDNKDALMIDEIRNPENYLNRGNAMQELLSIPSADGTSINNSQQEFYGRYFEPFFSNSALNSLVTCLKEKNLPDKGSKRLETVISNIEVLAHNMEQVVSFIEFGDEPDWRMFV